MKRLGNIVKRAFRVCLHSHWSRLRGIRFLRWNSVRCCRLGQSMDLQTNTIRQL